MGLDANTVISSVTILGVAFLGFLAVRNGRGIKSTHDAVKTRNGTTLGQLASDDEDRRLIEAGEPPTEGPVN